MIIGGIGYIYGSERMGGTKIVMTCFNARVNIENSSYVLRPWVQSTTDLAGSL